MKSKNAFKMLDEMSELKDAIECVILDCIDAIQCERDIPCDERRDRIYEIAMADLAREILADLGLQVEGTFCGRVTLKGVDE